MVSVALVKRSSAELFLSSEIHAFIAQSLKWQRLKPYEKFAEMIDRHWDGIAAYCQPENKVSLGFVEGLNNKIRVIQRRAYGLRNEEYLRLKILTCMLTLSSNT
jgi:transposase